MKLFSHAQTPKKVPYLHIGYMSASSFEIGYMGCTTFLLGTILFMLATNDWQLKMRIFKFLYALLIVYVVLRFLSN